MLPTALPFLIIYTVLTLALGWYDYRTGLLPDRLTCPLLWSGLLCYAWFMPQTLTIFVLGAIAGYTAFAAIYWLHRGIRRREGMGYGDVKYFAALGAWHGWPQLPALVTMASGLALLFLCLQMVHARSWQALKSPLRFGPFLSAAGFVVGWQQWVTLPL